MTNGTAANGIDSSNPSWSSGGTLIAFDSNAAGVAASTGLLAGTAKTRDIFVSYLSGPNTAGRDRADTPPVIPETKLPRGNSIQPGVRHKGGGPFADEDQQNA